jgi:hypothetical protein
MILPTSRPTFRSKCRKPIIGFLALLASVTTSLLPAFARSTDYKEPDYGKSKVEDGPITTVKQALDGWQSDCLKNGKDAGYEVKGQ